MGIVFDGQRDRLLTLETASPNYEYLTWVKDQGKPWKKLIGVKGPPFSQKAFAGIRLLNLWTLNRVMLHYEVDSTHWETWLWDGTRWAKDTKSKVFPPTFKLAFDSRRNRVLAYGLRGAFNYSIWEWTLANGWKLIVPNVTGLPLRRDTDPYMAYDPVRDRLVIYFDRSGNKSMFYEWDGKNWKVFKSPQFPNVPFAYLSYSPSLEGCVLFGGWDTVLKPTFVNNGGVWLWKGGKLTKLPNASLPNARSTEGLANGYSFDPNRNLLWISYRGEVPTSLWKFKVGSLQTGRSVYHLGEKVLFDVNLPKQASHVFVGFLSLGQTPMIPVRVRKYFGVQSLPLAPDLLFQASMGFGLFTPLSGTGKGRYTLPIPQDKGLLGLHLFGSGVSFGRQGLSAVADQVAFRISR